jgi:hypothetical protein
MLPEPDGENNQAPGVLPLVIALDDLGVEVVRHGGFVSLRGLLSKVPPHLWGAIDANEEALVRLLANRPTPYRQRQGTAA